MWRWRGSGRSRQAGRGLSVGSPFDIEALRPQNTDTLRDSHTDFDAARVDAFRPQLLESAQARTIREDASHINAAFRSFCHGTSSTNNPQTTETIRGSTERVSNAIRDDAFSTTEIGEINKPVASGNARYISEGISPPAASTAQSASPSSADYTSPSSSTSASSFASASLSSAASSTMAMAMLDYVMAKASIQHHCDPMEWVEAVPLTYQDPMEGIGFPMIKWKVSNWEPMALSPGRGECAQHVGLGRGVWPTVSAASVYKVLLE
ncbi:hypothetical protein BC936DRAFT_141462, partial [Jimgerdemannia flammicorona]